MPNKYSNLKDFTIDELEDVAKDIRYKILNTVSKNGGHLSSTLGATDLIIAMHFVFDVEKDPFIYDVSHQAYAHKLLTGRWKDFESLREFKGMSGYTKPSESKYDYYCAGHSSTSISLAVGSAKAIHLKGEDRIPVALIGDGSMSAGMVYEALNELGDKKYPVIIILNDNEMSISKPIGAVSKYLSQGMAGPFFQKIKCGTEHLLDHLPDSATYLAKRFEESLRLITPGLLFEELGIEYIGPVNGHNIKELIETLNIAKNMGKPIIIHTQTTKGKGYEIAEGTKEHWHGVGSFNLRNGKSNNSSSSTKKNATTIFSETLISLADSDDKVVGVTAAMPTGTGMNAVIQKYPDRFWDVAIAEQHAVTSMGSLAKEGFKPFCAIYSTFLQRGYDQIIHDIALMDLGVTFAIDRAGIVGEDGETHQGVFDISFLRAVPNMTLLAPYSEGSMREAMIFAKDYNHPCALRYPRGSFTVEKIESTPYILGKSELIKSGKDILFIGYGNGVGRAIETVTYLDNIKNNIAILDLRFVKPLDTTLLTELSKEYKEWFIFSDSAKMGGVGSAILEFLSEEMIKDINLTTFEYSDEFITHGNTLLVEESMELLAGQLAIKVRKKLI